MVGVKNRIEGVVYPDHQSLSDYIEKGALPERHFAEVLSEALTAHADKVALVGPQGSKTYAELDEESDRFAAALLDLGLKPLDRVMFQVPNSFEIVVAFTACWKANLLPVCTLAAHREAEISYLAQHSGARAHFIAVSDRFDFVAFADQMKAKVSSLEHTVIMDGEAPEGIPSMQAMIAGKDHAEAKTQLGQIDRDPFQATVFQLSGGTTSIPKIIPRFGNEYLLNIELVADRLGYSHEDTIFMPLQIAHNGGMLYNFGGLLRGSTIAIAPSIEPPVLLGVLMQHKPTVMALLASAVARMQAVNITQIADLSRLRLVISPNAAKQITEVLNVPSVHLFGMTEGLCTFGNTGDPELALHTTIGQPLSEFDEVKILEPGTERALPHGEVGEMVSKGPYTFAGYFNAEERNAEAFTSDGFYRSGDLMSVQDIEGRQYLRFEGRSKDIVSRGGEKINCEEVEMAARKYPSVADIAIVAMPDREFDERACAFIVPPPTGSAPDIAELRDFLVSEGLAKFKCPERIEQIDEFPQTDPGKLSKPKLRDIIVSKLQQEAA